MTDIPRGPKDPICGRESPDWTYHWPDGRNDEMARQDAELAALKARIAELVEKEKRLEVAEAALDKIAAHDGWAPGDLTDMLVETRRNMNRRPACKKDRNGPSALP